MWIKIRLNYKYVYLHIILCITFFVARMQTEFSRNSSQDIMGWADVLSGVRTDEMTYRETCATLTRIIL